MTGNVTNDALKNLIIIIIIHKTLCYDSKCKSEVTNARKESATEAPGSAEHTQGRKAGASASRVQAELLSHTALPNAA